MAAEERDPTTGGRGGPVTPPVPADNFFGDYIANLSGQTNDFITSQFNLFDTQDWYNEDGTKIGEAEGQ